MVRNPIGLSQRLGRLRGSTVDFDLRAYETPLAEIDRLGREIERLSDAELAARADELRRETLSDAEPALRRERAFALAREAARRVLGLHPFDVQIVAALALDAGHIVEMQTGEGKTLAAVLPACLNALSGKGVHILTFNDYLARRDALWMGPIYRFLGLSVGYIEQGMPPEEKRRAYLADVTYATAKEAGFDHLRDLLALDAGERVHQPFHFALVDEADSLLIDEARVPLVIAGSAERRESSARRLAELVAGLSPGVDFAIDEYGRDAELNEAGFERVEAALGCRNLHDSANHLLLAELHCALHARALLRRDVDYLVRDGRIELVDEFTGRVVEDRHWPDGLQAALEAKEGLERRADGRILGSITLQHFLGGYPRLCGMTGTARDSARELHETYGLRVAVIPTHRPMIRIDRPDVVFTHREARDAALVAEIRRAHESGRPVLVGTVSVEESERLAERLRAAGVTCEVLNARNDALEARIVARAGAFGAVTISTNMAGRGTDIRLGGEDEADHARVVATGGLLVLGTHRHESRRIDLQLRGRAGRQGDPGESRFFLSLEDDLLVRFGLPKLLPPRLFPAGSDEPIDHPALRREIDRTQRIADGQGYEIRKTLWRYSQAIEDQRQFLFEWRQALLTGREAPEIWSREPRRHAALVAAAGEEAVRRAETAVTLNQIDRAWSRHLEAMADLREGSHLVGLGGRDPLVQFKAETSDAFRRLQEEIDEAVLAALDRVRPGAGGLDLGEVAVKGPASTWTYVINDDPFRNQLGMLLAGAGRATFAIGAALFSPVFFYLWLAVEHWSARRKRP